MLEESDTYLMILEQGEERGEVRATRRGILLVGEARFSAAPESVKDRLADVEDVERLARMVKRAVTAATWDEVAYRLRRTCPNERRGVQ